MCVGITRQQAEQQHSTLLVKVKERKNELTLVEGYSLGSAQGKKVRKSGGSLAGGKTHLHVHHQNECVQLMMHKCIVSTIFSSSSKSD